MVDKYASLFNCMNDVFSLRKHVYSKLLIISPPKTEKFQIKNSNIFHISSCFFFFKSTSSLLSTPAMGEDLTAHQRAYYTALDKKITTGRPQKNIISWVEFLERSSTIQREGFAPQDSERRQLDASFREDILSGDDLLISFGRLSKVCKLQTGLILHAPCPGKVT